MPFNRPFLFCSSIMGMGQSCGKTWLIRLQKYGMVNMNILQKLFIPTFWSMLLFSDWECFHCDFRYINAATLSKNVIIMLDMSGSMLGQRFEIAKQTVEAILETLSDNDFFNILLVSTFLESFILEIELELRTSNEWFFMLLFFVVKLSCSSQKRSVSWMNVAKRLVCCKQQFVTKRFSCSFSFSHSL